jgi:hypothetical protein
MLISSMGGHHQKGQLSYYFRSGSATTKASFDFIVIGISGCRAEHFLFMTHFKN